MIGTASHRPYSVLLLLPWSRAWSSHSICLLLLTAVRATSRRSANADLRSPSPRAGWWQGGRGRWRSPRGYHLKRAHPTSRLPLYASDASIYTTTHSCRQPATKIPTAAHCPPWPQNSTMCERPRGRADASLMNQPVVIDNVRAQRRQRSARRADARARARSRRALRGRSSRRATSQACE